MWNKVTLRNALPMLAALASMPALPALAQDRGCDIETSSYVRMVPPHAKKSNVIVALPQTPCPVLDTGPQPAVGPITLEVQPQPGRSDGRRQHRDASAPRQTIPESDE